MFESRTAATAEESKPDMPTMGFLDHLEELRTRLVYSIAAVGVGFCACWWKVDKIYEVMQRPIMKALKDNGMSEKLVYLNPTEPFNLYLKIAGRTLSDLAIRSLSGLDVHLTRPLSQ
jgi:sec-independent protein translocase protein TatC